METTAHFTAVITREDAKKIRFLSTLLRAPAEMRPKIVAAYLMQRVL